MSTTPVKNNVKLYNFLRVFLPLAALLVALGVSWGDLRRSQQDTTKVIKEHIVKAARDEEQHEIRVDAELDEKVDKEVFGQYCEKVDLKFEYIKSNQEKMSAQQVRIEDKLDKALKKR